MKSLVISDKEKYGASSPMVSLSSSGSKKKEAEKKHAPTIELTGPQVEAFGLGKCTVGEKGTATVNFVVKAVKGGDAFGDELPGKDSPKSVTLSITHGEASEYKSDSEDEEDAEDGGDDEAAEGEDDGEDDGEESEDNSPKREKSDTVSPAEALGDDE